MKRVVFSAMLLLCSVTGAMGQAYPTRPIRFIVPFAAGGGTDLVARTLALRLYEALGQPVIVDNRTGASGVIGTEAAARSAPDGYTIMIATPTFTVNPSLMAKLPYDALKDFVPITLIATAPHLLAVNPSVPAKNIKELVLWRNRKRSRSHSHRGAPEDPAISPVSCSMRWPGSRWSISPTEGPAKRQLPY